MPFFCQVHIIDFIVFFHDSVGIKEVTAHKLCDLFVFTGKTFRFFCTATSHGGAYSRSFILFLDIFWNHHQNIGPFITPAVCRRDGLCNQTFEAQRNTGGRCAESFLGIVGSQHDDQ